MVNSFRNSFIITWCFLISILCNTFQFYTTTVNQQREFLKQNIYGIYISLQHFKDDGCAFVPFSSFLDKIVCESNPGCCSSVFYLFIDRSRCFQKIIINFFNGTLVIFHNYKLFLFTNNSSFLQKHSIKFSGHKLSCTFIVHFIIYFWNLIEWNDVILYIKIQLNLTFREHLLNNYCIYCIFSTFIAK